MADTRDVISALSHNENEEDGIFFAISLPVSVMNSLIMQHKARLESDYDPETELEPQLVIKRDGDVFVMYLESYPEDTAVDVFRKSITYYEACKIYDELSRDITPIHQGRCFRYLK